jgi:hypothetical protein
MRALLDPAWIAFVVVLSHFKKRSKIIYLQLTESERRDVFPTSWAPLGEKILCE